MTKREGEVISQMREVAEKRPDTKEPDLEFLRNWAYGNAGLENDKITKQQVDRVIKKK